MFHQDFQTPRSGLEKTGRSRVFLTDFELFGYLMLYSFECFVQPFKPLIILGGFQSKSSPKFMVISIAFPLFSLHGLLTSWGNIFTEAGLH